MTERQGIGLVGWLVSSCGALLLAAVMLFIAVRLIAAVWPWLLGIAVVAAVVGAVVRLALVRRRQQW